MFSEVSVRLLLQVVENPHGEPPQRLYQNVCTLKVMWGWHWEPQSDKATWQGTGMRLATNKKTVRMLEFGSEIAKVKTEAKSSPTTIVYNCHAPCTVFLGS